jgi:hypothetical protein
LLALPHVHRECISETLGNQFTKGSDLRLKQKLITRKIAGGDSKLSAAGMPANGQCRVPHPTITNDSEPVPAQY